MEPVPRYAVSVVSRARDKLDPRAELVECAAGRRFAAKEFAPPSERNHECRLR